MKDALWEKKKVPGWPLHILRRVLGRVGNRATQAGQGQAITKPWKANTEAETVHKLVKQYWEEHDTEISIRSKEGHPSTGSRMKHWKERKQIKWRKNPESSEKNSTVKKNFLQWWNVLHLCCSERQCGWWNVAGIYYRKWISISVNLDLNHLILNWIAQEERK